MLADTKCYLEQDGMESHGKETGRKEQRSDKKDEEREFRGGEVIARKTNGARTHKNMTYR